jgi:hypothetical protein
MVERELPKLNTRVRFPSPASRLDLLAIDKAARRRCGERLIGSPVSELLPERRRSAAILD